MPSRWRGDETSLLPAQQVEPYRLWFEFLKLESADNALIVDTDYYKAWGHYRDVPFDK